MMKLEVFNDIVSCYVIILSIDVLVLSPRHDFQLQILYSVEWNGKMITDGDCMRVLKE
jgi:hypothetical protein